MIEVSEVLEELLLTVGITCTSASFKAINTSRVHTQTTTIHTFVNMIRALRDHDVFCIELNNPIVENLDSSKFKINNATILLKKQNAHMHIEKIYTDEEEVYDPEEESWIKRANRRIDEWTPAINLLLLIEKIGSALIDAS